MKLVLAFVLLISLVACDKWAVLVAGSNTYSNYRHQADVYHAYQILKKNGFPEDRIITFAYDDIANNIKNPFKGKVFNKPTYKQPGVDVYQGVVIDYKGAHVNPAIFLSVLQGNKTAVKGIGSQRVLESTSEDNVFIYFADHGAPGLIAFPSKYLYAKDLLVTFAKMKGRYNKLVFYLQACESGSMFTSLPNNTKIYSLSAANPSQSSWGTYCSPDDVIQGKHIGSCLGDLFSVNFLQNTESTDLFGMTLFQQFTIIKQKTTQSHVMQWGDLTYQTDKTSEFLSDKDRLIFKNGIPKLTQLRRNGISNVQSKHINSRSIKLQTLMDIYTRERTQESLLQFTQEVKSVTAYDSIFAHFNDHIDGILNKNYDASNINFECLKESIDYFESKHGRFSDYGLGKIKFIARACELISTVEIKAKIDNAIRVHLETVNQNVKAN